MYWSGFDTAILIAGILTLVLAYVPSTGASARSRLGTAALGIGIVIVALVTGNLSSFTYPSEVFIAPLFPVIAGVVMTRRTRMKADVERRVEAVRAAPLLTPMPAAEANDTRESAGTREVLHQTASSPARHNDLVASGGLPMAPPLAEEVRLMADLAADQAGDPSTEQQILADIAYRFPELRSVVAANPSAYPALRDWIAQAGSRGPEQGL
jgi:hypothetical protein